MKWDDRATIVELAREGIANLVNNCAEVEAGELVILLNDPARIDKETSSLIEEAVRAKGGTARVIWTDGPPEAAVSLGEADKIIAHADTEKLPAEIGGLLVTNRSGKVEYFSTAAARYHWGILQVIYD